jgi:hypothetical protein
LAVEGRTRNEHREERGAQLLSQGRRQAGAAALASGKSESRARLGGGRLRQTSARATSGAVRACSRCGWPGRSRSNWDRHLSRSDRYGPIPRQPAASPDRVRHRRPLQHAPERPFDLVCDSGCLHSLVGGNAALYKDRLLGFLLPGGSFVLEYWGKRHALDWRPIGPRRRSQTRIERMVAPELQLIETDVDGLRCAFLVRSDGPRRRVLVSSRQ